MDSAPVSNAPRIPGARIAVVLESTFIPEEVSAYLERFPALGAEVELVSRLFYDDRKPSEATFTAAVDPNDKNPQAQPQQIIVRKDVSQVDLNDYEALIMAASFTSVRLRYFGDPDWEKPWSVRKSLKSAPAVQLFDRAMDKPLIKGFLCHGLWILTPNPARLQGRKVICHSVVMADVVNCAAEIISTPTRVVTDGDLVTGFSKREVHAFIDAIATAIAQRRATQSAQPSGPACVVPPLERLRHELVDYWQRELALYIQVGSAGLSNRPIADIVRRVLALPSYDAPEAKRLAIDYVKEMTGFGIDTFRDANVLIAASDSGTWASELCVPASLLLSAGYKVTVATETGSPPHMLSVSRSAGFVDGSLGVSVVSEEEAQLAARYLDPASTEATLLKAGGVRNLSEIVRPPIAADFLKDEAATMEAYRTGLMSLGDWLSQFDALVIAGGSGAVQGFAFNGGLHNLVLAFNRLDKPIVAQCNGVFALVQTIDPRTDRSIINGRFVTTHSKSHEYRRGGWGWAKPDAEGNEVWTQPGADGNPIIDSEPMVRNAVGISGAFMSPPATPYAVAVDGKLVTARTTPDGGPATAALLALLEGWEAPGPMFAQDGTGFQQVQL